MTNLACPKSAFNNYKRPSRIRIRYVGLRGFRRRYRWSRPFTVAVFVQEAVR